MMITNASKARSRLNPRRSCQNQALLKISDQVPQPKRWNLRNCRSLTDKSLYLRKNKPQTKTAFSIPLKFQNTKKPMSKKMQGIAHVNVVAVYAALTFWSPPSASTSSSLFSSLRIQPPWLPIRTMKVRLRFKCSTCSMRSSLGPSS